MRQLGFLAVALSTCGNAAPVSITATQGPANQWHYVLSNLGTSPTDLPVYFALGVTSEIGATPSGVQAPAGWGAYTGPGTGTALDGLTFGVGVGSNPLQTPAPGNSLAGFSFTTSVPCVLETQGILYGIGRFSNDEIVAEGEMVGPVPVPGVTQAIGAVTLSGFAGSPGAFRLGGVYFEGNDLPSITVAAVDGTGTLLCAGPATPGVYDVTLIFPGYLNRRVSTTVANGACSFAATLTPGDVDASGEIDAADIDLCIANFGAVGD
jgi:hypothetical protein